MKLIDGHARVKLSEDDTLISLITFVFQFFYMRDNRHGQLTLGPMRYPSAVPTDVEPSVVGKGRWRANGRMAIILIPPPAGCGR